MQKTPGGMRKNVVIFGNVNTGKSTLFNMILGHDAAIVSSQPGTTTDPVVRAMELLPFGPITLIDCAGLDDETELGKQRVAAAKKLTRRADVVLLVQEASKQMECAESNEIIKNTKCKKLMVFTKCDLVSKDVREQIRNTYPDALLVRSDEPGSVQELKNILAAELVKLKEADKDTQIGDLLPPHSTVITVVEVDSGAPAGRLILPQVQFIRDCLDHGITPYITKVDELEYVLDNVKQAELVVVDSQVFAEVDKILPKDFPLTSFSFLLARQKGNLEQYYEGINHIKNLQDDDKILILEACVHNATHEDIGRVKIPNMLKKHTGKNLIFSFCTGYQIPDNLTEYALAILCGSCMINKKEVHSRLEIFKENNIAVTNYGIILAYFTGILMRCKNVFE